MNKYSEAIKYFNCIKKIAVDPPAPSTAPTPQQAADLAKEKANYDLILNIYNQSQDLAALVSNVQFSEPIRNIFLRLQKAAFSLATEAYDKGLQASAVTNYLGQIKGAVESIKPKMPQGTFEPFDLLNKMINTFKPMNLSAQSKNNAKKPAALVAITPKPGSGKLPTNISVQMPVK